MEPVSIASSIAALAAVADSLFLRAFRYIQSVKKADKEIKDYAELLQLFAGVLHRLKLQTGAFREADGDGDAFNAQVIAGCFKKLDAVRKKLEKQPTQLEPSVVQKLKWPFSRDEVKDMIKDLERQKNIMESLLAADSMSRVKELLAAQTGMKTEIHQINHSINETHMDLRERISSLETTQQDKELLSYFGVYDAFQRHDQSCHLRLEDTGSWFTSSEDFTNWLSESGSKLWLQGIPGAGKTVLASVIIEEIQKHLQGGNDTNGIAYFYCDYKDAQTQIPHKILGTLASQLAAQNKDSLEVLRGYYTTHHAAGRINSTTNSKIGLAEVIREMSACFDQVTVVVDGLDECGKDVTEVVRQLYSLNAADDSNIRTLFLSRDEHEIRIILAKSFTEVSIAAQSDDIRRYVAVEVQRQTETGALEFNNPALKEEIMEKLVAKAEGMFRWVACQIDYLCSLPNDRARRNALMDLPPDLNSTYGRMLDRINKRGQHTQTLVQDILRWLILSLSPLSIHALRQALAVRSDVEFFDAESMPSESAILRNCGSFVRKSADGEAIELAHFTVEEFFRNISAENHRYSAYRIEKAHSLELARCCLTFLNLQDFRLSSPDLESHRLREREHPFWIHAVLHWWHYARPHFDDPIVFALGQSLFNPNGFQNLISWARAFASTELASDYLTNRHYGQKIDSCEVETDIEQFTPGNVTPLHYAAMLRWPALTNWLLAEHCDVNQITSVGTPLHCCLMGVDALNYIKKSPGSLSLLMSEDLLSVARLILDAGADCSIRLQDGRHKYHSVIHLLFRLTYYGEPRQGTIVDSIELLPKLLDAGAEFDGYAVREFEFFQPHAGIPSYLTKIIGCLQGRKIEPSVLTRLLEFAECAMVDEKSIATSSLDLSAIKSQDATQLSVQLRLAAQLNRIDTLEALLRTEDIAINAADRDSGDTALHKAVASSSLKAVQLLLTAGASIDAVNRRDQTPLHLCATTKDKAVCLFLLREGSDVQMTDENGSTIWHLAAKWNNETILTTLLSNMDYTRSAMMQEDLKGHSPIFTAAIAGSKEALLLLARHVPSLNSRSTKGLTLAHACQNLDVEQLDMLLKLSLDFTVASDTGSTALHYACEELYYERATSFEFIEFLVRAGVDPNIRDKNGDTALNIYLRTPLDVYDGLEVIEYLATALTINNLDSGGNLPIHRVLLSRDESISAQILKKLIHHGADITKHDSLGRSSLEVFLDEREARGHFEGADVLYVLLEQIRFLGIDFDCKLGARALTWACGAQRGDSAVELLIELGVNVHTSNAGCGRQSAVEYVCRGI